MSLIPDAIRGPLFMVVATGSYVINDTLMKVATADLSPYEVLVLRGLAACLIGMPLLFAMGLGRQIGLMFDARVITRNLMETGAILSFIIALAHMPIADVTALGQITPLLVLIGVSLLFGERIGWMRICLISLGFAGAIMVAQPTLSGVSPYVLLAFANASFAAIRDIVGRRVAAGVPGLVVAMSAVVVVLAAALIGHLVSESWVVPTASHLALMAGAGFFLIGGHFFIFTAYRIGPTGAVAPFYYGFSVWAVLSGFVVFGQLPNPLAIAGIILVVGSGLVIVIADERRRRRAPAADGGGKHQGNK